MQKLIQQMDRLIATILLGNNLVNTAIAAIATVLCTQFFGTGKGLLIGTILVTVCLVIFCELTPKIFATNHPEGVSFFSRHLVSVFIFIFNPITRLLTKVSNGVIRLFGGNPQYRAPLLTEGEIKAAIQIGREQGFYGDDQRKMLEKIFHFDEIEVKEVMTTLDRIVAVPTDIHEDELERVLLEEGHNRIPVYRNFRSNIVGVIYVRDIIYLIKNSSLIRVEDLMSAPYYVSPDEKVSELLKEFQRRKIQIAIVRNPKSGNAQGLVTLEDLVEEIVGEIDEKE